MSPRIVLITGPSAAGKSTVAQAVAERMPRSVHLRGDVFRRMVVNGRATFGATLDEEAIRQLELRYDLAVVAALRYLEAGFNVVYQDIVVGPALEKVVELLSNWPLTVIVLVPGLEAITVREQERLKTAYGSTAEIESMLRAFTEATPRIGTWIDSTDLTVSDTIDAVLRVVGPV
ncbi:MAG: AAA family ATPase [Tepidiformaceae bacterium]